MQQIEDLTLIKFLGKGSYGEVYLSSIKGKNQYFATKKMEREIADRPTFRKYFENEINLLKTINHPYIVKLEGIKATKKHYYIIMEYINGGGLSDCLKKYMKINNKAFPEEIVQHLMKQIIEGLYYLHKHKIIHRDLKLDNIMVNFDSDKDKQNLNMMKAKIKIIDFGFATKLSAEKNDLAFTAVGTALNMDPLILNKFTKRKGINLGYDQKVDIWSIGTVCYELLIGKAVFDAETLTDLIEKVENGNFTVPKTVSKEIVSFLNSMLQYDSKERLSAEELRKHPFLIKNYSQFTKMNTARATKKQEKVKKTTTIWGIFNNEEQYVNIQGGNRNLSNLPMAPIAEENTIKDSKGYTDNQLSLNQPKINPNMNFANNNINKNVANTNKAQLKPDIPGFNANGTSFYGHSMHPNPQMQQKGMPGIQPMMVHPQQQMMQPKVGVGMPQNYPQNLAAQQNILKTLTLKQNSNKLLKGIK